MYFDKELEEIDKYWNDLIYTVCRGEPAGIRELISFDIFDFFAFIGNFEKELKDAKKRNKK